MNDPTYKGGNDLCEQLPTQLGRINIIESAL